MLNIVDYRFIHITLRFNILNHLFPFSQNLKYLLTVGLALMGTSACFLGNNSLGETNMGIYFPAIMLSLIQTGSGLAQVQYNLLFIHSLFRLIQIYLLLGSWLGKHDLNGTVSVVINWDTSL